jgi:hypothetical protein
MDIPSSGVCLAVRTQSFLPARGLQFKSLD